MIDLLALFSVLFLFALVGGRHLSGAWRERRRYQRLMADYEHRHRPRLEGPQTP